MKERPILFNGDMVRAILSGAKTQTRRIYAGIPKPDGEIHPDGSGEQWTDWGKCPFGQPGDHLWVRETWGLCGYLDSTDWDRGSVAGEKSRPINRLVEYRSDWNVEDGSAFWRPSIHMPRWASRITLEITDVRVERLNELSDEDAQKEGITSRLIPKPWGLDTGWCANWSRVGTPNKYAINGKTLSAGDICHASPRLAFWNLWESVYGPGTFDDRWCWVIQFKRVTP